MTREYFNIDQLAPLLNQTTRQLQRMAEREEIPAQRIGGEWRFSRKELRGWLLERVGTADESGLVELEQILDQLGAGFEVEECPVADLLHPEGITVPLEGKTAGRVIESIVKTAMSTNLLWDEKAMITAVHERENMYPTAMDNGVALLHPRRPMTNILADPFIALGITHSGVPFADNGVLTDVFFLICSTNDTQHLRTLARLSRIITSPDFLPTLRTLSNPHEIIQLFRETERGL
ncbi:MAG: PTS sugar transporter subunit IIA [Planctomycetia bacterium]|nr:PTS sugar transporter subunit IIA [Planctomycetia bacterium]